MRGPVKHFGPHREPAREASDIAELTHGRVVWDDGCGFCDRPHRGMVLRKTGLIQATNACGESALLRGAFIVVPDPHSEVEGEHWLVVPSEIENGTIFLVIDETRAADADTVASKRREPVKA